MGIEEAGDRANAGLLEAIEVDVWAHTETL